MAYVYRHIRLDKNEPFYIGIANHVRKDYVRANERARRSEWWKKIVSKTEYRIDILFDNVTVKFAKEKEIEFIKLYGRRDLGLGTLVNMTDGGDGLINRVFTPEYRKKLSDAAKNRVVSDSQKQKLREYRLGKTITDEHREKIRQANLGKIISIENRLLSSKRMTENNPSRGKCGKDSPSFKGYIAVYKEDSLIGIYDGVNDTGRILNVRPTKISACIKGRRKSSGGYTYKRISSKDMA